MIYFGIDIGGTKCSVSMGKKNNGSIDILSKIQFFTICNNPWENLKRIEQSIGEHIQNWRVENSNIAGIGISCGGPLDSAKGIILSPPNLPGWDRIPVVDYFKDKFNVPVYLHNDANACAVAEWKFGAGRGYQNLVFITFGTGLGAGLILSGHLYTGTNDMAGEIGHIRLASNGPDGYGKFGSMEGFCSGGGIGKIAKHMLDHDSDRYPDSKLIQYMDKPDEINAKLVADLADEGDEMCETIYKISGEKLGMGLSVLIDILNPEIIIIGSIFTRSKHLLWDSAKAVIDRESLKRSIDVCKIVCSELGDDVGDYAALSLGMGDF